MDTKFTDVVTYWAPTGVDEYGDTSFSSPTQIYGRWEDTTSRKLAQDTGKVEISNSTIYTLSDLSLDGYVYLGTSVETSPKGLTGFYRIMRINKVRSLLGERTLYEVMV
jgi:hypothetical protein